MFNSGDYSGIIKFFAESLEEVIKGECRAKGGTEYIGSDFVILLDCCISTKIIIEHMHASLMKLKEISRKFMASVTYVPDLKPTQLVKSNSWKYNVFPLNEGNFTKEDAMEVLMIAYDFMFEHQRLNKDCRYEPYLSLFYRDFIEPLPKPH